MYGPDLILDETNALRRMGGGVICFRDIMMWWKIFTCGASEQQPFCKREGLDMEAFSSVNHFTLNWGKASSSDAPYKLTLGPPHSRDLDKTIFFGEDAGDAAHMDVLNL